MPSLPPAETTIVVVAEHALVRAGLRTILDETPGLRVVAVAQDASAALDTAGEAPDVVLLAQLPDATDDVLRLRRALPTACIVSLEGAADQAPNLICIPSESGVSELCAVLGSALGGGCAACHLRDRCPAPRVAVALSRREKEVAICVADGLSSKQIAATLGISLRTVNTYRESLARKIGASSGAVVTRYVIEHQLGS